MIPISVCIIAKNEEHRIEHLLASLAPYNFEIVIVDTGSTDSTKEIAAKYTDCIFDFVWQDDFSAARNFSLRQASNDWILMMDCDEWIKSIDIEELHYFRKHLSSAAGSITRENLTGTPGCATGMTTDQTERFFNRKRYHYTGLIHEQLTPKYEKTFETFLLNTVIGHDGYLMTEAERADKAKRNLSLLKKELSLKPDNPYILYQIGKGYDIIKDYSTAVKYYEQALDHELDTELAYVQSLVISYGEDLLALSQFQKAMKLERFMDCFTDAADYDYLMGLICKENGQYRQALELFERALSYPFSRKEGTNSYLPRQEIEHLKQILSEEQPENAAENLPMNIGISLNHRYVKYAYVMLTSLFVNNPEEQIHVYALHADLTAEDKKLLSGLCADYRAMIDFLAVNPADYPDSLPRTEDWSLETYFRLQLTDLLPSEVKRLLYLDIDVIVNKPLGNLYRTNFEDKLFCVCRDMGITDGFPDIRAKLFQEILQKGGIYFNAGVMLWNIAALRGHYHFADYLRLAADLNYEILAPDQDLLNYMHWNQVKYVDECQYDLFSRYAYNQGITYAAVKKQVSIIHFAGFKPWSGEFVHYDTEKLWWEYAKMTPFYVDFLEFFLQSSLESRLIYDTLKKSSEDKRALQAELTKASALCQKLVSMLPNQ